MADQLSWREQDIQDHISIMVNTVQRVWYALSLKRKAEILGWQARWVQWIESGDPALQRRAAEEWIARGGNPSPPDHPPDGRRRPPPGNPGHRLPGSFESRR